MNLHSNFNTNTCDSLSVKLVHPLIFVSKWVENYSVRGYGTNRKDVSGFRVWWDFRVACACHDVRTDWPGRLQGRKKSGKRNLIVI